MASATANANKAIIESPAGRSGEGALYQIFDVEAKAADMSRYFGPAIFKEFLALGNVEALRRAFGDKHADATLHDDQALVLKKLIGLGDGERIGAMFGGKCADGGQRIAVLHPSFENGRSYAVAEAEVDGAIIGWHGAIVG